MDHNKLAQMERMFILSFFVIMLTGACSSPKQQPKESSKKESGISFDSIEKNRIDTFLEQTHQKIRDNRILDKIPYTVHDPTDTIYIFSVPENGKRISLELNLDNGIDWPTFYIENGELVYVRYRYFFEDSISSRAAEIISYYKDGEVIYANERGNELFEGQTLHPGSIRALPYHKSTRSADEIKQEYSELWQIILGQMKENDLLPKYLEKYLES